MVERFIGYVKFFNVRRGWGFIKRGDIDKDYFVHHTAIKNNSEFKVLHENQKVEFSIEQNSDGREKAIEVVVIPQIEVAKVVVSGGENETGKQ
jgi:CspA family cold shock protein